MQGRRHRSTHLDIYWLPGEAPHPRMGLIVPRFRQTAPERNRLRRRLKELFRRDLQPGMPVLDVVFRARRESYRANFAVLRAELATWRAALGA